ncbi:Arc family DNA-binding protein, partial [Gilliamella sp. Fer1-1]|uniref:Arc family DNA-binding protein n=1 Tax=Gilliamella sp. Fer1-1 TaxID=3120240 RepID=UPI001C400362
SLETFMTEKKARPYKHPQINLRIPEELKEKVQELADKHGRSMNAEIILALEKYLESQKQDLPESFENYYLQMEKIDLHFKKYTETIKSLTKILENENLIKNIAAASQTQAEILQKNSIKK